MPTDLKFPAIEVYPPDNPIVIPLAAISFMQKEGDGCFIRTHDGTNHQFHAVSFEQMKKYMADAYAEDKKPEPEVL